MLLQWSDRLLDNNVILGPTRGAPNDQADGASLLPINEDLPRLHNNGVGYLRIGDSDPGDVEVS
ncbi:MAG: hypothetical protein ABIS06_16270 [Vicinamibacterales bacterium]